MTHALMRRHPSVGTLYTPSLKSRVAGEKGGYLVRTNAAGFRSEREFMTARAPDTFRALMFGDSQTAGDGVPNTQRFSDKLEQAVAGLEVYNYGIGGAGPDQHLLAYREFGQVDHDLLILVVYAENIIRVGKRFIESRDADGAPVYYAKPYFQRVDGRLELHHVPVPRQIWSDESFPPDQRQHVYSYTAANLFSHVSGKAGVAPRTPKALEPLRKLARDTAIRFSGFRPLPHYDDPQGEDWLLLRAILKTWIEESPAPVLLVPLPHYVSLVSAHDPTDYRARFRELAATTGCRLYDPLPGLRKAPLEDRKSLWSEWSGHLSATAHTLLAERLAPEVRRIMAETRAQAAP